MIESHDIMDGRREKGAASVRASISFPPDMYEILEHLAKEKKVSLAWVVRDAIERYLAEQIGRSKK